MLSCGNCFEGVFTLSLAQEIKTDIASFNRDPLGFTLYAWPWGSGPLSDSTGPRKWQRELLQAISAHLDNPQTQYTPFQAAISSGHGIGKSAELAFIIKWGMATCPDCKVIVTAGTGTQLDTKTVPEVTKWFNSSIIKDWFDCKAQSITINVAGHERTWRTDFITWSENNPQAFAGAHNKGRRIIVIFDEASTIADAIWETTEGALTDEETEIIWLACSQPTINTGRFRECFGSLKHRWRTYQIDSRTVEGVNQEQIAKWVEDYGEDSDFVRVRVRGEFPRAGSNQFIPGDVVAAARRYHSVGHETMPRIGALDVARFGDNRTVLGERQGRRFRILKKWQGLDLIQVGQWAINYLDTEKPDMLVIDEDGIGGGVIDYLKHRGYTKQVTGFHGGAEAFMGLRYYNQRAECWGKMKDWLAAGAEIPDDPELAADLTAPEYFLAQGKIKSGAIVIESKEDMKKRGLASPDTADCLAMTFGVTVRPKAKVAQYMPSRAATAWS